MDCVRWCSGVGDYKFLGFTDVKLKVVVSAPLCEVGNRVLVCRDGVIVIEKCKYSSVIRVFEVCGDGCGTDAVISVEGEEEGA